MLKNKYIIILVVALSILGFVSQKKVLTPNQEIILQFSTAEVASHEAQTTVANLKSRLEKLGVDNIKLFNKEQGVYRISYYSDLDVSLIKNIIYESEAISHQKVKNKKGKANQFPFDEDNSFDYQFDIYEIQKHQNNNGLNGLSLVKLDSKSDRFYEQNNLFLFKDKLAQIQNKSLLDTCEVFSIDLVIRSDSSKSEPEVRAGPRV